MVKWSYQTSVNPLGFLQNWRLTEAEIDGFCHFGMRGLWASMVHVKQGWPGEFTPAMLGLAIQHGSCETPIIWCFGANQS